jgi:hypothetical protein
MFYTGYPKFIKLEGSTSKPTRMKRVKLIDAADGEEYSLIYANFEFPNIW